MAYLLLYVDDIILYHIFWCSSSIHNDSSCFWICYEIFGSIELFSGIAVTRHSGGLFLSQKKYAEEILERTGMSACHSSATPVNIKQKQSAISSSPYANPTHYRSLGGALQYLTFTRLDISYAVQQICLFMHNPMDEHMLVLKSILRYLKGTLQYFLNLHRSFFNSLLAYTDANWRGCLDTKRSTSDYCVFLRDNLLS